MPTLIEFLNHVLPTEGVRCWVAIKPGSKTTQGFCDNNEDLAYLLAQIDAKKWNAYFAAQTYSTKDNRKGENVKLFQSFRLDLDAGKGKPYRDYETAKQAVTNFAVRLGLPQPTLVCSGNGAHVYWTLEEPLEPKHWEPVAKRLKELTKQHGLDADPAITDDLSRLLRPINTLNYKNPEHPKEVYIDGELQPHIPNAIFMGKVNPVGIPAISNPSLATSILGGLEQAWPSEPAYARLVAERCGQVKSFRDCRGNVSERLWYANLSILANCADGEGLAQEWSSGHPKYTPSETEKKLEQARTNSGPTTCAYFKGLNAKGCEGCPLNITSPIQLGRGDTLTITPKIEEPTKKLWLPTGFKWGPNYQIMYLMRDPDSEEGNTKFIAVEVCKNPFQVDAWRVDETHGTAGDQSVRITKRTAHTKWDSFTMDIRTLMGPNWRSELGAKGVRCHPGMEKYFQVLVSRMIGEMEDRGVPQMSYASNGWREDRKKFIVGRKLFDKSGVHEASGNREFEIKADKLVAKGDFNRWRTNANKMFAPGFEAQGFGLLCSFAAPLMELMFPDTEGGGILSLISYGSGHGKSTALAAIETVWGAPKCVRITGGSSIKARFREIGLYKDLPVVHDEWGEIDAEINRGIINTFTGGEDIKRLTRRGESVNEPLTWKTVYVGATNRSVCDILRGAGFNPQANRIFEVPLPALKEIKSTLDSTVEREFEANYGMAGPAFISHLLKHYDMDELQIKANNLLKNLAEELKVDNDFRYALRLVVAATLAGLILSTEVKVGDEVIEPMLSLNVANITRVALDVIRDSMKGKEELTTYEEHIAEFIRDNVKDIVVVGGPFNPNVPTQLFNSPRVSIKGRYEKSNERIYIPTSLL